MAGGSRRACRQALALAAMVFFFRRYAGLRMFVELLPLNDANLPHPKAAHLSNDTRFNIVMSRALQHWQLTGVMSPRGYPFLCANEVSRPRTQILYDKTNFGIDSRSNDIHVWPVCYRALDLSCVGVPVTGASLLVIISQNGAGQHPLNVAVVIIHRVETPH
jgi:hypothetical protein